MDLKAGPDGLIKFSDSDGNIIFAKIPEIKVLIRKTRVGPTTLPGNIVNMGMVQSIVSDYTFDALLKLLGVADE